MKFKKIISAVVSTAMCFSMLAFNVSADEAQPELINMPAQINRNVMNINQVPQGNESVAQAENLSIAYFDEISEVSRVSGIEQNMVSTDNEASAEAYSAQSNIQLSKLGIIEVWLGKTATSSESDSTQWRQIEAYSSPRSDVTLSIDSTGYSYIKFVTFQWGYTTGGYVALDGKPSFTGYNIGLNRFGQEASAGEIIYGWEEHDIFKIPTGSATSEFKNTGYYDDVQPMISITTKAHITWTTPTGPAPTTPEIFYNTANMNDYAIVIGLSTDMEYRGKFVDENQKETYSSWNSCSAEAMIVPINSRPYTLQVRYKYSTNGNPSLNCEIPVKSRSNPPSEEYFWYYDIVEILAIYQCEQQIEIAIGDGASYFPIDAGFYTVSDIIDDIQTGAYKRIYIRYAATEDEPASQPVIIRLNYRNPNTPDDVYYQSGMLWNLTPDMVFSFNGGDWYSSSFSEVDVTAFMSETETTLLEIKYMPNDTMSCSATRQITLPALA